MEQLEEKLDEVTDNTYVEIGNFMNEYMEKELVLMQETYDKCKKWLDDNNKPYREEHV